MASRRWQVVLWVVGAVVFVTVGLAAACTSPLPGDRWLLQAVQDTRFPGVNVFEEAVDAAGHWAVVLVLSGVTAVWLVRRHRRARGVLVATAPLLGALPLALKPLFGRPRPAPDDVVRVREFAEGYSFPSGHAFHAAMIAAVVFIASVELPPGRGRTALRVAACVLALGIGWERVFDGAHWPSDVFAGFLLGFLAVFATWKGIQAVAGATRR